LKNFPALLPPLALQQQFARVVQDVERIREQQVASGKEIEGLCEGLMQRTFKEELVTQFFLSIHFPMSIFYTRLEFHHYELDIK